MKDKYKIRQAIMNHLYNKMTYDNIDMPCLETSRSTLQEIAKDTNYTYDQIKDAHHGIPNDMAYCDCKLNTQHCMILTLDGITCALDDYWIREGRREVNERVYDTTKWLLPLLLFIVTVSSLTYSATRTSKIQSELEQLKKEVSELRGIKK